jgi:threonine/homoserine/homoserine lactone efflux protein
VLRNQSAVDTLHDRSRPTPLDLLRWFRIVTDSSGLFPGREGAAAVIAGHALAFVLFAVVAAITPGPSNLLLTSTGAAVGVRRGLPALLGQVVGMGLMLFLVAIGLGSLVLKSPLIIPGLKWGGSGLLLWLAWKIATAGRSEATGHRVCVGFWEAGVFQWVNPKKAFQNRGTGLAA